METSILKCVRVDGRVYMVPARALSLRPPWHYFILNLPPRYRKDIENRAQGFNQTKFRGWCWVHAGTALRVQEYAFAAGFARGMGVPDALIPSYEAFKLEYAFNGGPKLYTGGIVGLVNITIYQPPTQVVTGWAFQDHHRFTLSAPTPTPFTPCPGQLGFWSVPYPTLCQAVRACVAGGVDVPFSQNSQVVDAAV